MVIKLIKIIGSEHVWSCSCGQPLIGMLCETHGSDIRISTKIIHCQFELSKDNSTEQEVELINLKLTENQLINLFNQKQLQVNADYKTNYQMKITAFNNQVSVQTILEEFFELLEFEVKFGQKQLREEMITNSGVTVHYMLDYKQTTIDIFEFTFEALVTRNLKDYLDWRLSKFKPSRENVINSLLTTQAYIMTDDKIKGVIKELSWAENSYYPNKITIQSDTSEFSSHKITNLYQLNNSFYLTPREETTLLSILHSFSKEFLASFKQFLQKNGVLAEIIMKPSLNNSSLFENLCGKTIVYSIEEFKQLVDLQQKI